MFLVLGTISIIILASAGYRVVKYDQDLYLMTFEKFDSIGGILYLDGNKPVLLTVTAKR